MDYHFDDDMPVPASRVLKSEFTNKLLAMKQGQSFVIPDTDSNTVAKRLYYLKYRYKVNFTVRKEGGGVREWRIG